MPLKDFNANWIFKVPQKQNSDPFVPQRYFLAFLSTGLTTTRDKMQTKVIWHFEAALSMKLFQKKFLIFHKRSSLQSSSKAKKTVSIFLDDPVLNYAEITNLRCKVYALVGNSREKGLFKECCRTLHKTSFDSFGANIGSLFIP